MAAEKLGDFFERCYHDEAKFLFERSFGVDETAKTYEWWNGKEMVIVVEGHSRKAIYIKTNTGTIELVTVLNFTRSGQ